MSNDTTPREAIMNVLDVNLPDWVDELGYQADAVIAHLWERASDPDLMSKVDIECGFKLNAEHDYRAVFEALLTELIGPHPSFTNKQQGNR